MAQQGVELFEGPVRSRNLGPAVGDRELGRVDGPGLYFFVGRNAGGKSTELGLLARAQDAGLLARSANVSDGESEAELVIGPLRITFRRSPGGVTAPPLVEGADLLPAIAELPAAIETLISGDGLKGEEERARRRLAALLSYAPIASSPSLVEALCLTLQGRSWPEALRGAFNALAEGARGSTARFKPSPYATGAEILGDLLALPRLGILDDHAWLLERLNSLGNTAEKAAAEQAKAVAAIRGRAAEALHGAVSRLAWEGEVEALAAELLREDTDIAEATERRSIALAALKAADAAVAAREGEITRRERVRAGLGPRPDLAEVSEEVHRRKVEVEPLATEAAAAQDRLAAAGDQLAEAVKGRDTRAAAQTTALAVFGAASSRLMHQGERGTAAIEEEALTAAVAALDEVRAAAEALDGANAMVADAMKAHAAVSAEAVASASRLDRAVEGLAEARRRLEAEVTSAERWDAVTAELETVVEGPDSAVSEAAAYEAADAAERRVNESRVYQRIEAELAGAQALLESLTLAAEDYRKAARDSWICLGAAVTNELALPWLQVDGLKIYVGYDGEGQLNADPERVRMAREQAEALSPEIAEIAGVALQRFVLERSRLLSRIDWRDLDDQVRLSTGELHEACLEVMLSRRGATGGIIVIPWAVLAALDSEKLARFAGKLEAAGLIAFSERPSRRGDPADLTIEKVEVTA